MPKTQQLYLSHMLLASRFLKFHKAIKLKGSGIERAGDELSVMCMTNGTTDGWQVLYLPQIFQASAKTHSPATGPAQ